MLLVHPITKSCVDTTYQSTRVSGSHLEVGVKKNRTGRFHDASKSLTVCCEPSLKMTFITKRNRIILCSLRRVLLPRMEYIRDLQ